MTFVFTIITNVMSCLLAVFGEQSQIFLHLLPNQELSVLYEGPTSQICGTTLPAFSPYVPRKYDKRFGTPAIV